MSGQTLHEWIWLGGHGSFVWSALGLCVAAMLMECITLHRARRRALRRIEKLHRSKQEIQDHDGKTN